MKEIKVEITTKKLIASGIVLALFVATLIGWVSVVSRDDGDKKVDSEIENAKYPFFPEQYFEVYMAPDVNWKIRNFQPIVTGFAEDDDAQYILAKYKDGAEAVRTIRIYITGSILGQPEREKIGVQESDEVSRQVTFDELKDIIKKGDQIDVLYLSEFTISEDVSEICVGKEDLCEHSSLMGRIYADLQAFVTDKTAVDDFVLPAFTISLVNQAKES